MNIHTIDRTAIMRRLNKQIATPSALRDHARQLEAEGLMRFSHAYGVWTITDKGRAFLRERYGNEA